MQINPFEDKPSLEELVKIVSINTLRIRMEYGLSTKELAEAIGSYYQVIQRIENGKGRYKNSESINVPSLPILLKISNVCNVCITEFFKPIPCQKTVQYINIPEL